MKSKFAVMFLAIALLAASAAAPALAEKPELNAKNCATHTLKGQCVNP